MTDSWQDRHLSPSCFSKSKDEWLTHSGSIKFRRTYIDIHTTHVSYDYQRQQKSSSGQTGVPVFASTFLKPEIKFLGGSKRDGNKITYDDILNSIHQQVVSRACNTIVYNTI